MKFYICTNSYNTHPMQNQKSSFHFILLKFFLTPEVDTIFFHGDISMATFFMTTFYMATFPIALIFFTFHGDNLTILTIEKTHK